MPFDVAHALAESGDEGAADALAYSIAFGECEGGEWDWSQMKWQERENG